MNTSTYYNLKLVEGTDIVNPLTTDVPNYETIDEQMHNNSIAGVTLATEVASGKVHALIRENTECAVIRFIATSNWALGDTITVDGIPVVAVLPSGEALDDGAYVVNANVLCILTGTNLTVYAVKNRIGNANEIPYNDTNVGAELTKLNGDITEINNNLGNKYQFVTLAEKINGEGTVHELSESIANFRYLIFELVSTENSYNVIRQTVIIPIEQFKGNIQNKVTFETYVSQRNYCHIQYTNDSRVTVVANNNTSIGVTILGIK